MGNDVSLKGVFDMHVHSAPDIRERRYTDFDLLEAGIRVGAKAIVIKSHHGFTTDRAYLCNLYNKKIHNGSNDFVMYGSLTLNKAVGGINPRAVDVALKMGAKVIWLPTQNAKNQLIKAGSNPDEGIDVLDNKGDVIKPLIDIFKLIKQYDAVLGTGHLSPEEIFKVVDVAKNEGLKKIVVTHPEFWVVGMSHEDQIRITKEYDVILERCYAQPMGGGVYKSNLEDNLEIIKKVGYKNVMIDTDGGQVENPPWEDALREYIQYMADNGVSDDEIHYMTRTIPSLLLNCN